MFSNLILIKELEACFEIWL